MANNVWFITGASKGLGLVLARQLLERGHRVAATSRTVSELTKQLGETSKQFLPLSMDITSEPSVADAVRATVAHFGALDVVVNNAGYGQFGTAEEVTDAEARRNFDVNVFGVLNVLRAALPQLREQRSGHVFNIASIGGFVGGFSGWGVYCATKFALAGLTESLRADLDPLGVGVTLVYPGYFRTSFLESGSMAHPSRPIAAYASARASDAQHTGQINGNQPGDPERGMRALIDVYEAGSNPLHLFLGSDAEKMASDKLAQVGRELTALSAISRSTDFPAG